MRTIKSLHTPDIGMMALAAVLAVAGAVASTWASGADGPSAIAIAWTCRQEYDASYHVRCTAQAADPAFHAVAALRNVNDQPGGTATRGPDPRPVANRDAREIFSAQGWRVALYAQPGDPAAVAQLLLSVLCDTVPRCTVTYGRGGARSNVY